MRERRNNKRRGGSVAAWMGSLWTRVTQRPVDSLAVAGAAAATLVIVVNAVFMQAGAKPAPFVAAPAATQVQAKPVMQGTLKSADLAPPRAAAPVLQQAVAVPMPVPAPSRRNDPIADLIGPSPRIQAVQRTLSEYGYGQVKPTGLLDSATSEAISKFEHDHKLPVTGRVSDRLVSALGAMAGHPIE